MKIVVLIKEVPDTYGARTLDLETGLSRRDASDPVLDEVGERALEVALSYADQHQDTVVELLSMGPDTATTNIRKGLAMGATQAAHITDPALAGADLGLTAEVLAAALRQRGFDLVIAGNQSTDGSGGVLPAMLAELLGVAQVTGLTAVTIEDGAVSGDRAIDGALVPVSAALPAVVSVTERVPDARMPSFKGIMAAKRKPYETLSAADLDIDIDGTARSILVAVDKTPERSGGVKIVDEGQAVAELVDYLTQHRLV